MKSIECIQVIKTADGSNTFFHKNYNEIYHSRHGAFAEAMHVFIEAGLNYVSDKFEIIRILEVGFGSGLNCFLTYLNKSDSQKIEYVGLDTLPLAWPLVKQLSINQAITENNITSYQQIIDVPWNKKNTISDNFDLTKKENSLLDCPLQQKFNLIYFDAFAPTAQAEMWTQEIFKHLAVHTEKNGVLVTYCAKGQVRRNMIAAGYSVEKIAGPPGKREMLRASLL